MRLNKILFGTLFLMLYLSSLNAQVRDIQLKTAEKQAFLQAHNQAFEALRVKVRDPFILKGPDDQFYLTGTTAGSHWGDTIGIKLWRSKDLADWEDLGFVWDLHKDGKAVDSWHWHTNVKNPDFKNPKALWAPEIHYFKETWWITHCLNGGVGHGLLKSTSGKPDGPYEVVPMIFDKGIDAHLFQDDNGQMYYLWGANKIASMNEDMTTLAEAPEELQHNGQHQLGYEGVLLLKIEDKYLHIASGRYGYEPTNTYDLYYAVSKELKSDYGKRRMAIKNAGHGNLFQDLSGRWWSTAFDHEYSDMWSCWLVPVELKVTNDDIEFIVKDERFRPTQEDQAFVKELATKGKPTAWEGKAPWWRPGK